MANQSPYMVIFIIIMRLILCLLFSCIVASLHAQVIDNAASYRNMGASKYFRVHYENDYFSTTDIYYTQGVNFEFVHPALANTVLHRFLFHADTKETKYGISLEHLGYTPTSISYAEILDGDRPFAACFFIKPFSITNDSVRRTRIVSSVSAGVIGSAAGGKGVQVTIHKWIGDTSPLGWNNQIQNEVMINYQFDYEKELVAAKYFVATAKAGVHVGTVSDKVYSSVMVMGGLLDNPFTYFSKQKRNLQLYIYAEPQINAVAYDATLQGGLFNQSSPYTISARNVNRIVFQGNMGLVIKGKRFNIEYFQTFLSREFSTGGTHHWGGVRLGWYFR